MGHHKNIGVSHNTLMTKGENGIVSLASAVATKKVQNNTQVTGVYAELHKEYKQKTRLINQMMRKRKN